MTTSADDPYVVETRNLTKVYRDFWGRKKVEALRSLNLTVRRGEIFGLLGPNGSGKTTTLKLLLGLLFPTNGEALLLGKPATDVDKNQRLGYLPEESYLYPFLSGEETLSFYGKLFSLSRADRRQRVDDLIQRVGLEHARKRPLREYSKGMTRRIGLAQALINDPELLLLDEPTSGLDPLGTREMKDMILSLRDQGKTVIMCSHLLNDVQDVCDRIAILYQGELKELGEVSRLLEDRNRTEILLENLSDDARQELEATAKRLGANVLKVGHPSSTLEELFVNIVQQSKDRPGQRYLPPSGDQQTADLPRDRDDTKS